MRKLLLGTTAVAAAALFGASHASAQEAPTVRIGGYFEFNGAYVDDDIDSNAVTVGTGTNARTYSRSKLDFRSDAEIHVLVSGKAANGLTYGMAVELQVDNIGGGGSGTGGAGTGIDTDEMWGYVSTPTMGTLQFGDQDNAADQLAVTAPGNVMRLGEATTWDDLVALNSDGTTYLVTEINDGNDSTKIIYLSPQFFGFDFGVSFAPNSNEGERVYVASNTTTYQRDKTGLSNEVSGSLRYRGTFGGLGVAASFGAMRADAAETAYNAVSLQDVTQYEGGLSLAAYGITVGGYYTWGSFGGATRTAIRSGLDDATNWVIGATYKTGAIAFGALFGQAERDNGPTLSDRKQQIISVGASYSLAPGLELFTNYTNLDDENIANSTSNPTSYAASGRDRSADIFVIGTRLSF